jgi:endonuclease YncB( thermonuclease family)
VIQDHDGDTFRLLLDAGCEAGLFPWLRVAGVDSPELNTPEGKAAAAFTADVLANAGDIEVEVHGRSFNRWVATVVVDGRDLAEVLIEAGHGVPR